VTDGLFSQALTDQCSAKISEWVPDYHGYGRAGAIAAITGWDKAGQKAAIPALLRVIAGDQEYLSRATAHVLAEIAKGDAAVKAQLLELIRQPRSIETLHAAFLALGRGWGRDGDVGTLAKEFRRSASASLQIDAIRVRADRGEADENDFNIFATLALDYDRFQEGITAPDLVSHFATTMQQQLVHRIERALSRADHRGSQRALVGSLVLADRAHKDIVSIGLQI
jgi:hypothetical protein